MVCLWPLGAVLALLAAGTQAEPEMRTKVLPGNGYIRYQVMPGDDDQPPGELIVTKAEGSVALPQAPPRGPAPIEEPPPPEPQRADACAPLRARLLARLFEARGLSVEPEFADWLERNLTLGSRSLFGIQVGGEPLLVLGVKTDLVARTLAEDLARCESQ